MFKIQVKPTTDKPGKTDISLLLQKTPQINQKSKS